MSADTRLRSCDYAACKSLATTKAGGWDFCDRHAEDDRKLRSNEDPDGEPVTDDLLPPRALGHGTDARARQHLRDGEKPCTPCAEAATRASRDREAKRMTTPTTVPTGPSPIARLLEDASGHGNARIRRLGERIEKQLDELRDAIRQEEERERERQAAERAKAEAAAEVARLEEQLREAKARLRGQTPAASSGAPVERRKRTYSPESLEKMRQNAALMRERAAAKRQQDTQAEGAA